MLRVGTVNALLYASAQVTLDSSGNGVAVAAPTGIGSNWFPIQVGVSTTTDVSEPSGNLFIGPNLPAASLQTLLATSFLQQLGGTATGSNDSIGFVSNLSIPYGQALVFQWLGGDPGAIATMTVTGTQTASYWR